jgi:hypothetical protein
MCAGARRRHGSPDQPGDGRAPYGRAKGFWQWRKKEKRPVDRPLEHDPEKHALGLDPMGGYRFSEKILPQQGSKASRRG